MAALPRPRFRGVSHRWAFFIAIGASIPLVLAARDARAAAATAVYGALLAGMFGTSATLHRADWGPRAFGWLRRADHAMIFAFIAGTYTPLSLLGVGGTAGMHLFALAWFASGLGILRALFWPHAPRVVTSLLYVAAGWVVLAYLPAVHAALDPIAFGALLAGGISYTVGAVVYATRWPDPSPQVFGFHEVFHALIIVGCACHFVAVARVALP
ncbi:MAG TPA: hemolysin III family protein [Kofleriaceae bacterium]